MNRPYFWVTRNCTFQNALVAGLLLTLAVFLGVLFFEWIEAKVSEHLGLVEKSDILKFVGIAMGGILVALQALASHRRARAMEDRVASTERGQHQERMKNAIEHLGHKSDSVRLGGAYELFHLAKDAEPVGNDIQLQQTVMDILCSHIRKTTGKSKYREKYGSKPSEEVQSILSLLFFQGYEVLGGHFINLKGSWLNGADLADVHLVGGELSQTHLQGANLAGAYLHDACFDRAQMQGAFLDNAQLHNVCFNCAQMQGADFNEAQLQAADFWCARMQGVNLASAQMQGAILDGAQLQGANLENTQLRGVRCEQDSFSSYSQRLMKAIGLESDVSTVMFAGGLGQEDVDSFVKCFSRDDADELREKLTRHIGKPASWALPKRSGAICGSYTKEEAERWIAEYDVAMEDFIMGI